MTIHNFRDLYICPHASGLFHPRIHGSLLLLVLPVNEKHPEGRQQRGWYRYGPEYPELFRHCPSRIFELEEARAENGLFIVFIRKRVASTYSCET